MVTRWHSVLNCSEHCSWVPAILVGLWLLGCSGSDSEEYRENSLPEEDVSSCEQSLGHLQEWTERPPIDTQQVAVMLSVCEAGGAMVMTHPLDCMLLRTPEEAAECGLREERQSMIDSCVQDAGEPARVDCETELGAVAPVVLAARMESFRAGYWLDLWSCHVAKDGHELRDRGALMACGLDVMKRLKTNECEMGQVTKQDCISRWRMQAPVIEARLRRSL